MRVVVDDEETEAVEIYAHGGIPRRGRIPGLSGKATGVPLTPG
jgi:hypothetical protein